MSFSAMQPGTGFAPGWFLADQENVTRQTVQVTTGQQCPDGSVVVPMGALWPTSDENAQGIIYEDVDVTSGPMPASLVTSGVIYEDRLPATMSNDAKNSLKARGFTIIATAPKVTRPY